MLKSAQEREYEQQLNNMKRGKSLKSSSASSKMYNGAIEGKNLFEKKQNIENIYYYKNAISDKA